MEKMTLNRFSDLRLNARYKLKNRIIVPPMASQTATLNGSVTQRTIDHYSRLAQSGAGLIFVEYTFVHSSGRSEENQLGISTDEHVQGLAKIVNVIHQNGSLAGIQLSHGGGKSSKELTGGVLMGPSPIATPVKGEILETPSPMTLIDIDLWRKSFVDGARRASQAGFDLVEFHSAHGYGLNQWLSPITNQRLDAYGGNLENRARLLLEIVRETRYQFPDLLLAARIPGQDLLPEGLSTTEMITVAQWLEKSGLNLLDISSGLGGWRRPKDREGEGYLVAEASKIKSAVSIPVIGVGGIKSSEYIDQVISQGMISFVAIGRAILEDPIGFRQRILDTGTA